MRYLGPRVAYRDQKSFEEVDSLGINLDKKINK